MLTSENLNKLKKIVSEVCDRESCTLYDLEFHGHGRQRILRVFVDKANESVSIDDCANISRGLSLLLDVEDLIPGESYELEVSSPGLERRLKEPWHFKAAIGKKIYLQAKELLPLPLELAGKNLKVKKMKGTLVSATSEGVGVEYENALWNINYNDIEKAKIIFELTKQGPIKHKR